MENTESKEVQQDKEHTQDNDEIAMISATRDRLNKVIQDIKEWNATQFPEADLPGQLMKLEEELHEFHNAQGEERLKELPDVFIVRRTGTVAEPYRLSHLVAGSQRCTPHGSEQAAGRSRSQDG